MRLLVIEPGLKLWGSERAFLATVPALVATAERVVVMTPPGSELAGALRAHDVAVVEAPIGLLHRAGRLARMRAAAKIVEACLRHRIDRIYLNQAGLCRVVHATARLVGRPVVIHVRLFEDLPRCMKLEASARAPLDLITISEAMHERVARDTAFKKVHFAYDPFEIDTVRPAERAPAARDFVCVGRIAEIKGQIEAIEGVASARSAGIALGLDLLGAAAPGDAYEARLKARVSEVGLDDAVRFLGYRTDAAERMAQYRFALVPSRSEPLGRVVMEAWNAGTLPICSRASGGAAEIVTQSGGGLTYEGHAPSAIADALNTAVTMPERDRLAMVMRGRAWAIEKLSLAAYERALAGVLFPCLTAERSRANARMLET